ncbi:MAG: nucleotidyltransferase domain-containing protein [Cyanobacteria bacterium P01_D01_bin.1]
MSSFISNPTAITFASSAPASVEARHQAALAAAEQCKQILEKEFDATEVIVFGSLRGDTPWHSRSDLDLAVRGISQDSIWDAYGRLEGIVPGWLSFDLVAIEKADERVRDRILKMTPIPENIFLNTKIRLEDELHAIEKTVGIVQEALAEARTASKILLTPALASYAEDFYSGCERISERVAVNLDDGLPEGESWHQMLLDQVSEPGRRGRPPLWVDVSLQDQLEVYRRFRHRVRHLYNTDLNDETVLEMARQMATTFEKVKQSVELFNQWLLTQADKSG